MTHRSPYIVCLSLALLLAGAPTARGAEPASIAYGSDPAQQIDVYAAQGTRGPAPIIMMVHGGGWRHGDKQARGVVRNKLERWQPRGFLFVSVNYRMLPQADVPTQAADVARALAYVQTHAASWGGDPDRIVLMGHSAGAHLAALLSADPSLATRAGARRWLGTVALDSAALDVPSVMGRRHMPLYDKAFGSDPAFWRSVSPIDALTAQAVPLLAVCSTTRRDQPCRQAHAYADKAQALGAQAQVLEVAFSHGEVNAELGSDAAYTAGVERFMASLDPAFAARLPR